MNRALAALGIAILSPVTLSASVEDARAARAILDRTCARCHQAPARRGGVDYILDRRKLVDNGHVVPGDPARSPLIELVESGAMPPPADRGPRPDGGEKSALRRWVVNGATPFPESAAPRAFLSHARILSYIESDVRRLPPAERPGVRYVSLAHLHNGDADEGQLALYRKALFKLLNSLSTSQEISLPVAIDPDATIFRVSLHAYGWTRASWERLERAFPFGVVYEGDRSLAIAGGSLGARLPFLRADWLVATASRADLYHALLFTDAMGLPSADAGFLYELERKLRIPRIENIRAGKIARAGFNGSEVSNNNRVIERHELKIGVIHFRGRRVSGYEGAYWISYDFSENNPSRASRQNIFAFPLGPVTPAGIGALPFRHAGGEVIFNLPNGLQAYLLVDERGNRIRKGPIEIVSDINRPDRQVENGLSCMTCHDRGMKPKTDQIRDAVSRDRSFLGATRDAILKTYVPQEILRAYLASDGERFLAANRKTTTADSDPEPVLAQTAAFERDMTLTTVAAELYLAPAELTRRLDGPRRHAAPEVDEILAPLRSPGGTVKRDVFVGKFESILRRLVPEARAVRVR